MNCNCQEVAEKGKRDIENSLKIPFAAHESAMARTERQFKRLITVIILLIVLLVGSNAGWLWYESTMETVEETTETVTATYEDIEQLTDTGGNNVIGGDYVNGEAKNR